jgi:ATP-dependent DNA helicase RecG
MPSEVTPEVAKLLPLCIQPSSRQELQTALSLRDADHFRIAYLQPAIASKYIERTVPDKPNSRLQKYRLTSKGRSWLKSNS